MRGKCLMPVISPIPLVKVNSFPNDKILDRTKLKAFADNKLNVSKMTISSSSQKTSDNKKN